mgnify:FL=1
MAKRLHIVPPVEPYVFLRARTGETYVYESYTQFIWYVPGYVIRSLGKNFNGVWHEMMFLGGESGTSTISRLLGMTLAAVTKRTGRASASTSGKTDKIPVGFVHGDFSLSTELIFKVRLLSGGNT